MPHNVVTKASRSPALHDRLAAWVDEVAALTKPDQVHWCDGSQSEWDDLTRKLETSGTLRRLDPAKRPNSFWAASDPRDVARVESRTFICAQTQDEAGPTNNWADPAAMRKTLVSLFSGCMRGRTMYVVPFSMGPIGHRSARLASN